MSRPSTHTYETVYILSPTLVDEDVSTIHQKVDNVISKFNGKVITRDDWGITELAYVINNHKNGRFVALNYTGDSGVVEEIERHFKILSDVMRYVTIAQDKTYDYTIIRKQIKAAEEDWVKSRELRHEKKMGDRGRFGDRGERKFGDRGRFNDRGDHGDRKFGDRGDRGERKFGDRGDKKIGERSEKKPTENTNKDKS